MPFSIERNDLASVEADAIVVAANEQLQITGGVGLTVARTAGLAELQAACDEIGFCPCGSAVATPAFGLHAKVVVHAVGPVWGGGTRGEADFLRSAYDAALECAVSAGAGSVAVPLISAGTYGFPADVSLAVAREAIRAFLNRHDDVDVRLVLYSRESVTAGMAAYLDIAAYIDDRYLGRAHTWEDASVVTPVASAPVPLGSGADRATPAEQRRTRLSRLGDAVGNLVGQCGRRESAGSTPPVDAAPLREPAPAREPEQGAGSPDASEAAFAAAPAGSLEDMLATLDAPFSSTLLALIDERGMTDAQVYKRANMSRQLFSKIRSDADYRPSKKTALALAVALGLNLEETRSLLARAGFALSTSSKADVIVEFFIRNGRYDIFEINEALYAFDQPLL